MALIRIQVLICTTKLGQNAARVLAQVNSEQPGCRLTCKQHDGYKAENVT